MKPDPLAKLGKRDRKLVLAALFYATAWHESLLASNDHGARRLKRDLAQFKAMRERLGAPLIVEPVTVAVSIRDLAVRETGLFPRA